MDEHQQLPAEWLESLARSEAQAERGEIVPLDPFMERLRASIDRMKADRVKAGTSEAERPVRRPA